MELTSLRHEVASSGDAIEFCFDKGWSDGLPVIPPTAERVARMVDYTRRAPDEIIATIAPAFGAATVESIAINAVLAGCYPEYMPVLIAAVAAMAAPEFNLRHIQTTTNPAPIVFASTGAGVLRALRTDPAAVRTELARGWANGHVKLAWTARLLQLRTQLADVFTNLGATVPDLSWEIKDIQIIGDQVIVRGEATGTPKGEFWGAKPTGKSFNTMAIDIFTVKNGKLASAYHVENWVGALQQLAK